jgi:hypothetical protein
LDLHTESNHEPKRYENMHRNDLSFDKSLVSGVASSLTNKVIIFKLIKFKNYEKREEI